MQLLNIKSTIAFMSARLYATLFSAVLLIASVAALAVNGLNWGLDFTGGTLVQVGYTQAADLKKIRQQLEDSGFGDAIVQNFGASEEVLIRIAPQDGVKAELLGDKIVDVLKTAEADVEKRRIEFVGPSVGEELTEQGGLAMLFALLCILVYV